MSPRATQSSGRAQFGRLPIELRFLIWSFVAPEVQPKRDPQVFALNLIIPPGKEQAPYHLRPISSLNTQTAGVRKMLSVHQESRAFALSLFPDALTVNDETGAIIRFDSDQDLDQSGYQIDNFSEVIQHLGLGPDLVEYINSYHYYQGAIDPIWYTMKFLRSFENLDAVYYSISALPRVPREELMFCVSHKAYRNVQTDGETPVVYCWPDLNDNEDYAINEPSFSHDWGRCYAEFEILVDCLFQDRGFSAHEKERIHQCIDPHISEADLWYLREVPFWKMVVFSGERAVRRFRYLDPNYEDSDDDAYCTMFD
ncbi:hypothetical protein GGR57DRAFT_512801 [Xylariaceae sp. FL1272]|nr:hypothetical protein GGR57DRAFT_512801 [Xylariaceae sp. FL1272]